MCGIVGYIGDRWQQDNLRHATDALQHRGPDAAGTFFEENCGLGHRRLSIIDLSDSANQPFHDPSGRYVMVFNGEIYNFRSLQQELDVNFQTHSDTEVLLHAFIQWGTDFVHRLNGMFAIVIYDREAKKLYAWRDRTGIKPLYYYFDGSAFAFASELKALMALGIPKEIDMEALGDYLHLESIPAPRTIFKQVKALENGHCLIVEAGKLQTSCYYFLPDHVQYAAPDISEEKALDLFLEKFEQSVQRRLVGDVPVGAFLSGGADSSMVCAMFKQVADTPFEAHTIGFDDAYYDESSYAEAVAAHLRVQHQVTRLQGTAVQNMVEELPKVYCQPFASGSALPSMLVCNEARKNVTISLSGDGGDELFMGYNHYHWYRRLQKMKPYGGKLTRKVAVALLKNMDSRKQRAARVMDYEDPFWISVWSQTQDMFSQREISRLLNYKYEHSTLVPLWDKIEAQAVDFETKISLFDQLHYLPNNLLHKMDMASMAHGLEVRLPFLDHELTAAMTGLPTALKLHPETDKYLLKKALERYLPKSLIYRRKWGFPAPVGNYLRGHYRQIMETLLDEKRIAAQGIFDPTAITRAKQNFLQGKAQPDKRLWALFSFQLWYEQYM